MTGPKPDTDPSEVPAKVGAYRVLGVIGSGGSGTVLRGENMNIGRPVAIKILREALWRDSRMASLFLNKARAAAAIQHPGIVQVHDLGQLPSGAPYLVMELLQGQTLRARLKERGRLSERESFAIVRGIADALAAAHARDLVHLDITPDRVFLAADPKGPGGERVKLLDFGIATDIRSGMLICTPTYTAPERLRGDADHRADLYSVGCVLMELLTGAPPFVDLDNAEMFRAHLFNTPPTVRSRVPNASEHAERLVAHLLERDPNKRVQSAAELRHLASTADAKNASTDRWTSDDPTHQTYGDPTQTTLGAAASQVAARGGAPDLVLVLAIAVLVLMVMDFGFGVAGSLRSAYVRAGYDWAGIVSLCLVTVCGATVMFVGPRLQVARRTRRLAARRCEEFAATIPDLLRRASRATAGLRRIDRQDRI